MSPRLGFAQRPGIGDDELGVAADVAVHQFGKLSQCHIHNAILSSLKRPTKRRGAGGVSPLIREFTPPVPRQTRPEFVPPAS